jgi:hypothetical protein
MKISDLIGKKINSIVPLGGPMIHTHMMLNMSNGKAIIIPMSVISDKDGKAITTDFELTMPKTRS